MRAFTGFMALAAAVFLGITVFFTSQRVSALQEELVRSVVDQRGSHVSFDLTRDLNHQWTSLSNLAAILRFSDKAVFRSFLTHEVGTGEAITWAGYVNVHGDVVIGSRYQGEGQNVASEEWFQVAQRGPSIRFSTLSDGREVLVMTSPVQSSSGVKAGFVTFQFHPEWFDALMSDIANSLSVDLAIFDDRGRPVIHTFPLDDRDSAQVSVRNALAGQKSVLFETWQGLGARYAASIPYVTAEGMPMLGWRIVVLISPQEFGGETNRLLFSLAEVLGGVAVVLLLMSLGFIRFFLVPLHRLVESAHDLAEGADVLPAENHRTAELSLLSSALARLQGRLRRAEDRAQQLQQELDARPSPQVRTDQD